MRRICLHCKAQAEMPPPCSTLHSHKPCTQSCPRCPDTCRVCRRYMSPDIQMVLCCQQSMQSAPHWLWEHRSRRWWVCTRRHWSGWSHWSSCPACTAAVQPLRSDNSSLSRRACSQWLPLSPGACQSHTWRTFPAQLSHYKCLPCTALERCCRLGTSDL